MSVKVAAWRLLFPELHPELVGERGFEPPTPWSRTRCSTRLSHSPTTMIAQLPGWRGTPTPATACNYSIHHVQDGSAGVCQSFRVNAFHSLNLLKVCRFGAPARVRTRLFGFARDT